MNQLSDQIFQRMFRFNRVVFDMLLNKIAPYFANVNITRATNSSGSPIPLTTRLGVMLRWLAGSSYLDLCFAWGISTSTFYQENDVLWPTMEALDKAFPMGFPFGDEARLEELSEGFRVHSSGLLDGCVMAIDGFSVSTCAPFKSEVENPKDYCFHKAGFAIIVLGGVDVHGRFYVLHAITAEAQMVLLRGRIPTYMMPWNFGGCCLRIIFLLVMRCSPAPSSSCHPGREEDLRRPRMCLTTGCLI
jgi:hypothetical protein